MTNLIPRPANAALENAETLLRASEDYRVLKRIPPAPQWRLPSPPAGADVRRAAFIDVETTGIDIETDEVIELAILPFDYDPRTGVVLRVAPEDGLLSFREPGIPIPEESQAIHGIRNEDVKGAAIEPKAVEDALASVQLAIAHNAAFDRPMLERIFPIFETKAWACSLADIDWRAAGMGAGKLDYLLMRFGWFFDGHRAQGDAEAGVFLPAQPLPNTERTVLAALLDKARAKAFLIRATGAPYESRALLKRRGYRWDPGDAHCEKAWWVISSHPDAEMEWLKTTIYGRPIDLIAHPVSPRHRHSVRASRP